MSAPLVAIIIPAYNAASTIARAVISALRESCVNEVIVINDASTDDTRKQALSVDDGTTRLKVIDLSINSGPSAARNRGIAESTSPWIGILDADDFFLPGRFTPLFANIDNADFIADDRWRVSEENVSSFKVSKENAPTSNGKKLDFKEFVFCNIASSKNRNNELGYIKPIIRRKFLEDHNIKYQESMRLGEDYELYARALMLGARFLLVPDRGYVTVVQKRSLSSVHTIEDLRRLRDCDTALAAVPATTEKDKTVLRQHYLSVDCRLQWRVLIDSIKHRNFSDALHAFLRPFPVPFYLVWQLLKQLFYRATHPFAHLSNEASPEIINTRHIINTNWFCLLGLMAASFLLISQKQALVALWSAWQTEEYSHGIFVVVLALLLALNSFSFKSPHLYPSWLGCPLLFCGAVLQLIAQLAAFDTAAEYGLILGLTGLCLAFLGRRATTVILPALIYLLFAVPLPHLFQAQLSQKLQLVSSSIGVMLLDWLDIPVFQEGNIIDLGGYRLQVVEACNGLRYIFPLMSFGYLVALMFEGSFWKRALILLSTIPIAILLNSLRIAIIGITVDHWGQSMAEGMLHTFEGWTIFIACLAILLSETCILGNIGAPAKMHLEYLNFPKIRLTKTINVKILPSVMFTIFAGLFAFLFCTVHPSQIPEIHPQHPPFAAFPMTFDKWEGKSELLPPDIYKALQVSDYLLANFGSDRDTPSINLYIAYYESQRIGTTTHSPSNCIPGGGWQIDNSSVQNITLPSGTRLEVTQLLISRGQEKQLVEYWFQERGRDLTETTIAKWYLLVDSIIMHRSDGALVRLVTPLSPTENQANAEERLNSFIGIAYPSINAFIPGANAL